MSGIRFDHVAIAVPRIADAIPFVVGELGGQPHHAGASKVFRFAQWTFADGGRLEVLEPLDDNGFLRRFLDQRGPGIHHVTFQVPRLADACARAEAAGYGIVGYDDRNPAWKEAFLHPREALGIVVQFAESSGGETPRRRPSVAPPGPHPVTLVGLRLRVRSIERAERQWADVLHAEAVAGVAGERVYRWPGSPMRVVVEVDRASPEGPVAIEVSAERPLALPTAPHPMLGATFRRSSA